MNRLVCPHCGFSNASGAAFCGNCGQALTIEATSVTRPPVACATCGHLNPPEAIFCGNCGNTFAPTGPEAAPPAGRKKGWIPALLMLAALAIFCGAATLLLAHGGVKMPPALAGLLGVEPRPIEPAATDEEPEGTLTPTPTDEPAGEQEAIAQATMTSEAATIAYIQMMNATDTAASASPPTATPTIPPTLTPSPTPQPPTVTPIPDEIVFQSNRDGDFEIYIMSIDGSNQRPLTNNTVDDRFPRASPDGRRIVYESGRGQNAEIYVMNRDGSGQQRLTFNEYLDELPAWSPDGHQIVFATWLSASQSELFIMNADGSNQRQITDTSTDEGHVSWSAAGLAFNATESGEDNYQLYLSDANGGARQRLTNSRIDEWSPEWSPDGAQLLFLSERGSSINSGIYVMDLSTREARLIYNNADSRLVEWGAVWSADGSRIVFAMDQVDGTADIYMMNADGSSLRLVAERGGYPAWAAGVN